MFRLAAVLLALLSTGASAQLLVTEVMYDPASNEDRWEWIEVMNTGDAAIDLDGVILDRVGDRERLELTPNIQSQPLLGDLVVDNPTIVPAGGLAILYNSVGLGYEPDRFRAAWPATPVGTTLIGVEGWSSNRLTNRPAVSDYAPSLPGMVLGFWEDTAAYRADIADFGSPAAPDRRVFRADNAMSLLAYDDDPPWTDALGRSAIIYLGGPVLEPASWGRSNAPFGGASESQATYLPEPVNGPDHGSPGVVPSGVPVKDGLLITELMYNPASITGTSNEWEWVEVLNTGSTIDFGATPAWLDDDDGSPLAEPNLTAGAIARGETAVFFNASAASLDQMRTAWDRPGGEPINWIPVQAWPALANGGDRFGLWLSAEAYQADQIGEVVALPRAAAAMEFDDSGPWPTGVDGDSIRLANLSSPPNDPGAWARARGAFGDPTAWQAAEVTAPGGVIDNAGGDQASPGFYWPDKVSPLPGDHNGDRRVDAADYTLWRDGDPLATERATVGINDEADRAIWSQHYGLGQSSVVAVPEPAGVVLVLLVAQLAAACGLWPVRS